MNMFPLALLNLTNVTTSPRQTKGERDTWILSDHIQFTLRKMLHDIPHSSHTRGELHSLPAHNGQISYSVETNSFFLALNASHHSVSKVLAQPCSLSSPFSFLWRLVPTLQPGIFFMSLKNMASDRGLEEYISSKAGDQLVACHWLSFPSCEGCILVAWW